MAKKKKGAGYRAAVFGAGGTVRFLIYVCGVLIILWLGKTAYSFGYNVMNQEPVARTEASGQDVTVVIKEGASTYEIGNLLKEKGLIREGALVFWTQERLSDFHGKLQPGTYILNTSQTVDEMLEILAKENTEGQPAGEESDSGTEGQSTEDQVPEHEQEGTQEGGE